MMSMRVLEDTPVAMRDLAGDLGHFNDNPGHNYGKPAVGSLSDYLAATYRRDPVGFVALLRGVGVGKETEKMQ